MEPNQLVKAHYKTGIYIGRIIEDRGQAYLVEVLAVDKHPQQGDLHNPGQTENVFFHQRKALSFREKANVPKAAAHHYDDEIPAYETSLKDAVEQLKNKLNRRETSFNQRAYENVLDLERQYFR
ncbi:kinase [Pontibacillus halophilus JSM 076056 = DSM 19796]|uniref:Kinase n=1 Tax=Pontibacillus halophilus JSM 076056 = DSM 19796 TaxID=1385510 RepID=A0A0A5G8Y4_9BACI|nr:kinase-associated lipoprotein B [Pontibacillus halophilus]KGX89606.1 kinase [Pontibacillus halophilus JSM 076056 = DSM 19796]